MTPIIIAAAIIVIILLFPGKKKKGRNGTDVWENPLLMRIAQFANSIIRKIKNWIGE